MDGKKKTLKTKKIQIYGNKKIKKINLTKPEPFGIKNEIKNIMEENPEKEYFLEEKLQEKILGIIKEKELNDKEKVIRIDDKRGGNSIHSWELGHRGEIEKELKEKLNKMVLERRKGEKDGNAVKPEQVGATKEEFEFLVKMGYLKHKEEGYDFKFGALSYEISKIIPINGISPTITCTDVVKYAILTPDGIRKMTPLEAMRLQGFEDEDYLKLRNKGIKSKQIFKRGGMP